MYTIASQFIKETFGNSSPNKTTNNNKKNYNNNESNADNDNQTKVKYGRKKRLLTCKICNAEFGNVECSFETYKSSKWMRQKDMHQKLGGSSKRIINVIKMQRLEGNGIDVNVIQNKILNQQSVDIFDGLPQWDAKQEVKNYKG